jgi:hypothetical protein
MKKFLFLLCLFAIVEPSNADTQPIPKFEGSKEDAIATLRNSEFVDMLRYHEDISTNIDRFLNEVNKIVAVDSQERTQLETQMIAVIQNKEGDSMDRSLAYWPRGISPFIGSNILAVLEKNFSASEYEKLSEQLSSSLTAAASAYRFLCDLYDKEMGAVVGTPIDIPYYVKRVYDYFDI